MSSDFNIHQDHSFLCPYCSRPNSLALDDWQTPSQTMVTDCETCCRPIKLKIEIFEDNRVEIEALPENG